MAKRASTRTQAPKVASRKSDTRKLGEALGDEMLKQTQQPGMTPQASTPLDTADEHSSITHSMIAERAYQLWKKHGGTAEQNWLEAERELRNQNIVAS